MEGYGVDITAPEPPFVLFKVIARWWRESFLGTLFSPLFALGSLLYRLLATLLRFVFDALFGTNTSSPSSYGGGGAGAGPGERRGGRPPVAYDDRIPRPKWAPDLSMMQDEYL